ISSDPIRVGMRPRSLRWRRGPGRQERSELMGNPLDELAKGVARGMSRREALRQIGRLGAGLAGLALATLGVSKASAQGATPYKCSQISGNGNTFTGYGPTREEANDRAFDRCFQAEGFALLCSNPPVCEP